ncbi:hypothetical protein [Burkholderia sp. GS2Y]|uniref:Uncharacterized protein n=1 Tax=Burkholderia theae TaxID=3143496 RepID=A0ABU9WET9_9BURK
MSAGNALPETLTSDATIGSAPRDDGASIGHVAALIDAENNRAGRAAAFRRAITKNRHEGAR